MVVVVLWNGVFLRVSRFLNSYLLVVVCGRELRVPPHPSFVRPLSGPLAFVDALREFLPAVFDVSCVATILSNSRLWSNRLL